MPGVQGNFTSNNSTSNSGIVNGSGPAGGVSEIYIDGINLPEADQVGDPRFTWTAFGVDAVDQFQVQTAGYSRPVCAARVLQNYSIKTRRQRISTARSMSTSATPCSMPGPSPPRFRPDCARCPGRGTAALQLRRPAARVHLGGVKPREIMNEFGIVLSGPIIKNKLFLFGNYGQYRDQNGASADARRPSQPQP